MTKSSTVLLALFVYAVAGLAAAADDAPLTLSSGEKRVALIELYTSEGCSSCPPADDWMSRLKQDPNLWRTYVPVAFHVDYWDYIGWKDRFANAANGMRQRQYAREGGARAVYTPGLFRDGKEWRDWRTGKPPAASSEDAGELRLLVDGTNVEVQFEPVKTTASDLRVHVAVLGMNLRTQVEAGENRGRTLNHDFVTLALTSAALKRDEAGFGVRFVLPQTVVVDGDRAIVAWVSDINSQAPLQSVGGDMPVPSGG